MKHSRFITVFYLLLMSVIVSSCSVIEGIFKAGMGFGIFLVVAVIVLILYLVFRLGKK